MDTTRAYFDAYRRLRAGSVTRTSALCYPIYRRLRGQNRLDLASGEVLVSPVSEPLLTMFDEAWVEECYRPAGWTCGPDGVVLDIGACVGAFTLWAARRAGAGRVIAVEPTPSLAAVLRANIERNGIGFATVREEAVGGHRRRAPLFGRGPGAMNTLYTSDHYGSTFHSIGSVDVVTLDDLLEGIERCDLLKLDCEGAEYEILAGASAHALASIRAVAAEYHVGMNEGDPDALARLLEDAGFRVTVSPLRDEEGGILHAVRAA